MMAKKETREIKTEVLVEEHKVRRFYPQIWQVIEADTLEECNKIAQKILDKQEKEQQ